MKNDEIRAFFESDDYCRPDESEAISKEEECVCAMYQILGQRDNQEDALGIFHSGEGILAAVCDGMGGLNGGEKASRTALEILKEGILHKGSQEPLRFLMNEAQKIDRIVSGLLDQNGKRLNAGTTMVAAWIERRQMSFITVGDSRIYLMRGKRLIQLTEDQNYGMLLKRKLQSEEINRAEFQRESAMAEALVNYIGIGGLQMIGCNSGGPLCLMPGDKILLCSDGLYKSMTPERMAEHLIDCTAGSVERTLIRMVDEAEKNALRRRKKQDNTSVILVMEL